MDIFGRIKQIFHGSEISHARAGGVSVAGVGGTAPAVGTAFRSTALRLVVILQPSQAHYIFLKLLIPEKPAIILLIHNQLVLLLSRKKFSFKTNCCVGLWKIIKAKKVLLVSKKQAISVHKSLFQRPNFEKALACKGPFKGLFLLVLKAKKRSFLQRIKYPEEK